MSVTTTAPESSRPVTPDPLSDQRALTDYVRSLDDDMKHVLFLALLREALAVNGDAGLMPIDDEHGRPFGYYVPPKAAEEIYRKFGPQLSENEEQEIDRQLSNPSDEMPMSEFVAELKRQLASMQTSSQ